MTLEEFKKMWEEQAKTEAGAIKMYLIGVLETVKEKNPEGNKMVAMCVPKGEFSPEGKPNRSQNFYLEQFGRVVKGTDFQGAIAASYLGGTPDNMYKHTYETDLVVYEGGSKFGEKESKVFVKSGGKDNPSPVVVKKNKDGYWKLFNISSLCTGVKVIKSDDF